jgi:hypothetical protein
MKRNFRKWYDRFNVLEILRYGWNEEHKLFARTYAARAKHGIDRAMEGLGKEAGETRRMAESFFRLLEHKLNLKERSEPPTPEEVKNAIEQLKDMGRFSIFITAVILPGGVISLIGLELLARKFGIDFSFIPSNFRKMKHKERGHSEE